MLCPLRIDGRDFGRGSGNDFIVLHPFVVPVFCQPSKIDRIVI